MIAAGCLCADLWTKYMIFKWAGCPSSELPRILETLQYAPLHRAKSWVVIPGLFDITLSINTGGAFGVFRGMNTGLAVFTLFASGLMIGLICRPGHQDKWMKTALSLMLAGALGNFWDRVFYGCVRDFLDFHWRTRYWPTFNLADTWICIAAGIMIYLSMSGRKKRGDADGKAADT